MALGALQRSAAGAQLGQASGAPRSRPAATPAPLLLPSRRRASQQGRGQLLRTQGGPDVAQSVSEINYPLSSGESSGEPYDGGALGHPLEKEAPAVFKALDKYKAPKWAFRTVACLVLGGQVVLRIFKGNIHWRNTAEQLKLVGPASLGVSLLTAGFVGMVFTIQFVREFAKLGLTRSVGGVLALALSRELTPVVTAIILAGRVGSAFAAELGTMQVSEQIDSLRVLFTDPVDYLVTPRVLASMIAGPLLNVLCFCMGIGASVLLADLVYSVPANVILDSARRALTSYDVLTSMVKSWVFGTIVATISCAWGFTTSGGAKGVGESTTSAVVISLVTIFIADFCLSFLFFQGQGDALKQLK